MVAAMMRTAEECIAQAEECERMAARAPEATKVTLLSMAENWRKLARQSSEIRAIQTALANEPD